MNLWLQLIYEGRDIIYKFYINGECILIDCKII